MYLYDRSRRDLIANGVKIDGVSVGGLREAAARTKVQQRADRPPEPTGHGALRARTRGRSARAKPDSAVDTSEHGRRRR